MFSILCLRVNLWISGFFFQRKFLLSVSLSNAPNFRSWIVALLSLFSHILSDFIFQSSNYKTQSNIHWVLTLMLGAWTPEIMKSPCLLHQETTGEDWIVVLRASLTRLQEEMVDIYDIWIPFWISLHVRVLKVVGKRWKAHPLNLY